MPQMAPIWWTTLFILFNTSFIIMMMSTYFQTENNPSMKKQITSKINKYNWKW
uniref:ATP synthase complex subunit 8 n=1 Tax=Rhynocoris incertis TaxID=488303 RepID=A0A343W907_9HEMI|nr:ATP synthase F0 subunit 8 [Rhynocoris incertis]AVZ00847.1 ATP synthase F0 subunit 8 [Rhynocoris incertis]